MISQETIKEFQKAVEEESGLILDDKVARKILTDLVDYFDTLAKIDHREKVRGSEPVSTCSPQV